MGLEAPGLHKRGGTLSTKVVGTGIDLEGKKLNRNRMNKRRVIYKEALPLGGHGGSGTSESLSIVSII